METKGIEYTDEIVEFLQNIFPDYTVVNAVMRASIEEGSLILPEIYVNFDQHPPNAETIISQHINQFLLRCAKEHNATYSKTLRRIVVEDIQSFDDLLNNWQEDWY